METKFMTLKYIAGLLFSYFASWIMPIAHFLVMTYVLVICDFVTGVRAAKVKNQKITSRGFFRTVIKLTFYSMAVLLLHGVDTVFLVPKNISFDLAWIGATFISLTELKSNLENISTITGIDIWSQIAQYIPDIKLNKKSNNKSNES